MKQKNFWRAVFVLMVCLIGLAAYGYARWSNNQTKKLRAPQLFSQQVEVPGASPGLVFISLPTPSL
jgi:hypothetical protein